MTEDKKEIVIDTDIFIKFTIIDTSGTIFLKIMDIMNVNPVMHAYVYNEELMGNATARYLVDNDFIKIYDYRDYLIDSEKGAYIALFNTAYKYFNYKNFSGNVFTYRMKEESLGEIRSSLMAYYLGIDMFMSDDGEAKAYIVDRLRNNKHWIEVYNLYDTLYELKSLGSKSFSWQGIKSIAKSELSRDKYDALNTYWHL